MHKFEKIILEVKIQFFPLSLPHYGESKHVQGLEIEHLFYETLPDSIKLFPALILSSCNN